MCGFVGSINLQLDKEEIKKSIYHRGPDDQNGWSEHNIDLYHLRLSIIDAEGGKQPMILKNRYVVVFNGEIYNYDELNKKFNLPVTTNSDTETLLWLFDKLGASFLKEVDGMFALAILDRKDKKIFIARDRAGQKPLYIYHNNNQIVFASELNCLKALLPLQIEESVISNYLRLGTFYGKQTPYKNVEEVLGGTYGWIDINSLKISMQRWWNINEFYTSPNSIGESTALQLVDKNLHTAVKRRIIASDLEVGAFLSGGIDSGLVTAIASEYSSALKTFTISFNGSYNEAPLAKLVAEKYNTDHHELSISFNNLQKDIESILLNYGEPFFDSSAIPSFYVSQAAKKYLTVVLNGDGADELFGGYRRYVPFAKNDWFNTSASVTKTASILESLLPLPKNKKSYYNYIHRFLSFVGTSGIDTYFSATSDIFEGYLDKLINSTDSLEFTSEFKKIVNSNSSGLQKIMNLDFNTILFSDLLVKMDIATMANSLEGRSPFLSKELLEIVPGLPDSLKIKGKTTKFLLRKLAEKYLPSPLINQPKRGFEIPLKSWIDNELKSIIFDYLTPKDAFWRNFIENKWMEDVMLSKRNVPAEKRAKMIWTVFSLELWYQKTILGK